MPSTALLIIDIQNDYFPGGAFALPQAEAAGRRAGELLAHCRSQGMPVVHVWHEAAQPKLGFFLPGTTGANIHECVAPIDGEPLVRKQHANSFRETPLQTVLRGLGADNLLICGMMTNNCVDGTTRAAVDLGYPCVLIHDACAAASLSFGGTDVPAAQVHAAFVAALNFSYAPAMSVEEFMESPAKG